MIIFQSGDVFAGRFRLEQKIGQGGMGQVWRAVQLGLNRDVAVKIILPNVDDDRHFREMFLQEAHISARLNHPNIVPVVDFGEHESNVLWLVQIFIEGKDLGGILEGGRGAGLPVPLSGFIVSQILQGLQFAHENNVIHRDLKPGNILVSRTGDVRITDFGIAKVVSRDDTPSISTVLKGSPGYLAPEVLQGQPATVASDLFAVGSLFFELMTGRNPFVRGSYADRDQIFFATLNEEPPELASFGVQAPRPVEDAMRRLLAKKPAARTASAGDALEELISALVPFGREATPLALRKYLSTTRDTFVNHSSGAASSSSPAASPRPPSLGISGMAGQMAGGASNASLTRPGRRGARGVIVAAGVTLVAAATAATLYVTQRSPGPSAPAPVAASAPAPVHIDAGMPDAAPAAPVPAAAPAPADAAPPDAAPRVEPAPEKPKTRPKRGQPSEPGDDKRKEGVLPI